jgi:hypothetical protein
MKCELCTVGTALSSDPLCVPCREMIARLEGAQARIASLLTPKELPLELNECAKAFLEC